MFMPKLWGLLLSASAIGITNASPLAHIHVKFVQPPHIQEHAITTDGGRLVSQLSFLSVGRRNVQTIPRIASPNGSGEDHDRNFLLIDKTHVTPDFSNGLDYLDPLLLTGERAAIAVNHIYGHGELFFHEIPHIRALMRNQNERRENGLNRNILTSHRGNWPWSRSIT